MSQAGGVSNATALALKFSHKFSTALYQGLIFHAIWG